MSYPPIQVSPEEKAALVGTSGDPSDSNKYVPDTFLGRRGGASIVPIVIRPVSEIDEPIPF